MSNKYEINKGENKTINNTYASKDDKIIAPIETLLCLGV